MAEPPPVEDALATAREALTRGAWDDARSRFSEIPNASESAEVQEGLSWVSWWQEDIAGCLASRERAYRYYLREGDSQGAARMALWLGDDYNEFRGASAVADGWFMRAARILGDLHQCPEHGWLAAFEAYAAFNRHELDGALRLAREAGEIGRLHRKVDLEMFSLAVEGIARIAQGEVAAGLRCLDEAAAAAVAGEFENLVPAAWSCCLVMAACEQLCDYQRGSQWCQTIEEFSRRMGARFVTGVCLAHAGAIETWRGNWANAELKLFQALDDLTRLRPYWRSEGVVRLGQLRLLQGRPTEADALFQEASDHPLALEGMAKLSLERNDLVTARDLLERALRQSPVDFAPGRAGVLALLVRVEASIGDAQAASMRLDELRQIAATVSTEPMRATVSVCQGQLAMVLGDFELACDHFEDAVDLFARNHAPFETARARLELATALSRLERLEAAERESTAALEGFERVDARLDIQHAVDLLDHLRARRGAGAGGEPLTRRQVEVLRLISQGLSDQDIAASMFLSPHTIHRHVANIYNRLGCSTRAAAVAEASRLGLL